jgi:glutaredoxin-like protein
MLNYINPQAKKPDAISLFTKPGCPYCANAKAMLEAHGMDYEEINLGADATLRSLRAITGRETVPQVYINGQHIGGSDDLEKYLG